MNAALTTIGYSLESGSMAGITGWSNMICPFFGDRFNINMGDSFDVKNIWDNAIPVLELLKDIMQYSNLYLRPDVLNRTVFIDTKDKFLLSREDAEDYSGKINNIYSQKRDLYVDTFGQNIVFRFAVDKNDAYSLKYEQDFHIAFGSNNRVTDSGFMENETIISLKHLGATPMIHDTRIQCGSSVHPLMLPTIWKNIQKADGTRPDFDTNIAPRVLFYYRNPITNGAFGGMNFYDGTITTELGVTTGYTVFPDTSLVDNLHFGNYADKPGVVESYYANSIRDIKEGYQLKVAMDIIGFDLLKKDPRSLIWIQELNEYFKVEDIMDEEEVLYFIFSKNTVIEPVNTEAMELGSEYDFEELT